MHLKWVPPSGRRAFITAGGRGIGPVTTEAFAEAAEAVTIPERNATHLDAGRVVLALNPRLSIAPGCSNTPMPRQHADASPW